MPRTHTAAILWVMLSTALFTGIFASAKLADGAIGTFQLLFLRYAAAFATLAALTGRALPAHRSPRAAQHLIRTALGSGAAAAITWASAHMPLADATALGMSYGVFTVLLGLLILHETVSPRQWAAIALACAGALVVALGQGAFRTGPVPLWPMSAALLSGLLLAGESVLIRLLSQAEPPRTIMLHVTGFGALLMAGPALLTWQPLTPQMLLLCLGLGPVSLLAQYCTIRGYRMAPLSVLGPVDYSWLVFAGLLGLAVFGERPSLSFGIGATLIAAGGVGLMRVRAQK